ncbi:MAG: DinB family protein [Bacteroidota bacterium]
MPLSLLLVFGFSLAPADTPTKGVRAEILFWIADAEKKIVGLAEAMPEDKYGWRPSEGVRSVSEVFMHVATGNFGIPRMVGIDPPIKMEQGMEKSVKEKAKVVEMLKRSFAHLKETVGKITDADLDKATKMFGMESTYRNVLILLAVHNHEHLGQSIAYARSNGVTPPWSMGGE